MLTLICHVYNEELLLPYFIQQNRPHFDHAVFLDYASTDDSVALIRRLWPGAEIRPSRNTLFDAVAVDREVMDVEREFEGWKLCLNVTEMLLHPDLRGYLDAAVQIWPDLRCFGICPIVMVDPLQGYGPLDPERPLFLQRHHGWVDTAETARSYRFVHAHPDGAYGPGRHVTDHPHLKAPNLFLQWWGWSPMPECQDRKLQVQTRLPAHDRSNWHVMDAALCQARWKEMNQWSRDLRPHADYRSALERTCRARMLTPDFLYQTWGEDFR